MIALFNFTRNVEQIDTGATIKYSIIFFVSAQFFYEFCKYNLYFVCVLRNYRNLLMRAMNKHKIMHVFQDVAKSKNRKCFFGINYNFCR